MADDLTPEEQLAKQQAIADAAERRLASLEKSNALMKEELKHAEDLSNKVELAAGIRENEIRLFESRIEKMQESLGIEKAINAEKDKQTALNFALISGDEDKIALAKEDLKTSQEKLKNLYKQIEVKKRDLKIMKKRERAIKKAGDSFQNMLESTTGISEAWRDTSWGAMATLSGDAKGTAEAFNNMKSKFVETFTAANVLGSTFEKMIESSIATAYALDEQTAAVGKATGQGRRYDQMITDMTYSFDLAGNSMRQLGINTQEYAESLVSLNSKVAAFSKQGEGAQKSMVDFTATMDKLGIQNEAIAESYDTLIGAFRMSSEEAEAAIGDVLGLAMEIGVPPQQMAEEFNAASKKLAAYGTNMIDVFKKVSASAKSLNMDTTSLLGIMEQFDTFEGAATAVGNLNAVLGGPYLNSIQMVRMNEEQRTRAMIEAMEASNRSWKDMGKYEKMAIANAAGISDMSEANKIFGQSLSSYDEQMQKSAEADEKQKDFNEALKELQTLGDKMKIMFQSLAVSLKPVFTGLGHLATALGKIFSGITYVMSLQGGWVGIIVSIVLGLFAMGAAITFVSTLLTKKLKIQALHIVQDIYLNTLIFAQYLARKLANGELLKSILLGAKNLIVLVAQKVGYSALAVILGSVAVATSIASGAMALFNLVLSMNPVGLVILGVLALIAVFGDLKQIVLGIGKVLFFALTAPINAAIWALNKLIDGANLIPFVNIPNIDQISLDSIPFFMNGVTDFQGGPAIVGEAGPEMITMGKGANVVTNENVQRIMSGATDAKTGKSGGLNVQDIKAAFISAIQETGLASASPGAGGEGTTVIMKLNDREFGRAVYEKVEQKTNIIPK